MNLGIGIGIGCQRGGSAAFTPASLSPTRWVRGSYPGGTWTGEGGLPDFTEVTADVTQGVAVDGFIPAHMAGPAGTQHFSTGANNTVFGAAAGGFAMLIKPGTIPANNANVVSIVGGLISCQGAGVVQGAVSDTGLRASVYDGGYKEATLAGIVTATWVAVAARYDSTNLQLSINASAFASASVAAGAPTLIGAAPVLVGASQAVNNVNFDGDVMEVLTFNTNALTTATFGQIYAYWKARYPAMGLP